MHVCHIWKCMENSRRIYPIIFKKEKYKWKCTLHTLSSSIVIKAAYKSLETVCLTIKIKNVKNWPRKVQAISFSL